jgi:DNA primase
MLFSDDFKDLVRSRASIAAYASGKLAFDQRRSNVARGDYWACCPFHGESTPSFHILDRKGVFKCFGCGAAGDIFTLAIKLEGLSFPEAVARIADASGIALPKDSREDDGALARRKRLFEACAAAQETFASALRSSDGARALAYLEKRGIDAQARTQFGLGYAPAGPSWLMAKLTARGFSEADLRAAGLVKGDEGRRPWDFFRDRVTFPIADAQGRIAGFGGRAMDASAVAKYLNSPETPLFSKGRLLYRLKEARERLARGPASPLVVAEGYIDVIAFERAGVAAVAPLGTAIGEEQFDLLWRASSEPVFCFDGDGAGRRAADRALNLALPKLAPGRTLRVALLPEGLDPDDVFRRDGPEALAALLSGAEPAIEAIARREIERAPLDTPEQRAGLKQRMAELAGRIQDPGVRREYLRELARRADQAVYGATRRSGPSRAGARTDWRPGQRTPVIAPSAELKAVVAAGGRPGLRPSIEHVLRGASESPDLLETGCDLLAAMAIPDADLHEIREALLEQWAAGEPVDPEALSRHLAATGADSAAALVRSWRSLRPPSAPIKRGPDPFQVLVEGGLGSVGSDASSDAASVGHLAVQSSANAAELAAQASAAAAAAEELLRRQEAVLRRKRLEAEWKALATVLVTHPEIKADVAGLSARDEINDDEFARAWAMGRAKLEGDRALIAARETPPAPDA